ncbi:MAG TPA: adenylate/guanylate cyclase domain-containing protein [Pyrinomonadaceae bacterium]|nr:adenylate/guanylate cyclase domain-containing protein [Pyrinomonadaceae bacterium]
MATTSLQLPGRVRRLRRRRGRARTPADDGLEREALSAEKLRVRVMLTVIGVGVAFSVVPVNYLFGDVGRAFRGDLPTFVRWRFVILAAWALYLLGERVMLGYLNRRGKTLPRFYRYVTALVETSCPTAEILVAASYTDSSAVATAPFAAYPLFIVLSALRLDFRLCVFTGAVAAVEYTLASLLFVGAPGGGAGDAAAGGALLHVAKGVLLLSLGVLTGLVAQQIKKRLLDSFELAEERERVVSTFGQHVSPEVVEKLLEKRPGLVGEKRNVCVMFLDIRNFTGFAEARSPEEVVEYLESLFGFMIEIVNRRRGIINKFLGDGFMAVFGAPVSDGRDCHNAVAAAREILERLEREVAEGNVLPTGVRIGLHAGEAVTGSIGSQLRREYTVIGDVVNLASRIEQLNKRFGSRLLISESVWDAVREELTGATPMGRVLVKGRECSIAVYKLA